MIDSELQVIFVPFFSLSALQSCAIPVLRRHQHDDVLPDLPEGLEQLPQYTLLTPSPDWSEKTNSWIADGAEAFAAAQHHPSLVITSHPCQIQSAAQTSIYAVNNCCSRFPWHPNCQHIVARGCSVPRAVLQEAAARREADKQRKQEQQQQLQLLQGETKMAAGSRWWPVQLVPVAFPKEDLLLQDLAAAVYAHNLHVQQQQQQQTQMQREVQTQMLAPSAAQLYNSSNQIRHQQQAPALIVPLLLETVQRTAAAVTIQSSWRAHSCRVREHTADRLLQRRAAAAIQRAWRAYVLRSRLAMLTAASEAFRHAHSMLRFSSLMCLDVGSLQLLEAAAQQSEEAAALFPEHRLKFAIEPELGDLFFIETGNVQPSPGDIAPGSHLAAALATTAEGLAAREAHPEVAHSTALPDADSATAQLPSSSGGTGPGTNNVLHDVTPQSGICETGSTDNMFQSIGSSCGGSSSSSGSGGGSSSSSSGGGSSSSVCAGQEVSTAEHMSWGTNSPATQIRQGLPRWLHADIPVVPATCQAAQNSWGRAQAAKLVDVCCSVKELLDPAQLQDGCCSPQDVALLVTFKSKQQAAQRAALLAAFTYNPRTRQYSRLMTVQESPLGAAYRNLTGTTTATAAAGASRTRGAHSSNRGVTRHQSYLVQASKDRSTAAGHTNWHHTTASSTTTAISITVAPTADRSAAVTAAPATNSSATAPTGAAADVTRLPIQETLSVAVAVTSSTTQHAVADSSSAADWADSAGGGGGGAAAGGGDGGGQPRSTRSVAQSAAMPACRAARPSWLHADVAQVLGSSTTWAPMYMTPLQRIPCSATLLAAAHEAEQAACLATRTTIASSSELGAAAAAGKGRSSLEFHTPVLSRVPCTVEEVHAEDVERLRAGSGASSAARQAICSAATTGTSSSGMRIDAAHCTNNATGNYQQGSCAMERDSRHGCVVSQAASTLLATEDVVSIAAYLEQDKLRQVEAFKVKLAQDAAAAAAALAAEAEAKQQAVAAVKTLAANPESDAVRASPKHNTSHCFNPSYWPYSSADAAAATQALKQHEQAVAACRVEMQCFKQQQESSKAKLALQQQLLAVQTAAQQDKQARHWTHQQAQYQQHVSTQHRVSVLRHLRQLAPELRRRKQQEAGVFVSYCNQLSKHMRNHVSLQTKAEGWVAATQRVQQQREAQQEAAAAMKQQRFERLCEARNDVMQQQQQAQARIAAVQAIDELEAAAKRAAAAAQRLHERDKNM